MAIQCDITLWRTLNVGLDNAVTTRLQGPMHGCTSAIMSFDPHLRRLLRHWNPELFMLNWVSNAPEFGCSAQQQQHRRRAERSMRVVYLKHREIVRACARQRRTVAVTTAAATVAVREDGGEEFE